MAMIEYRTPHEAMAEAASHSRYALLTQILGEALASIRIKKGLTQLQLAERLSEATGNRVRQGYISRLERGLKHPSAPRLGLILDCLHSSFTELDKALDLAR